MFIVFVKHNPGFKEIVLIAGVILANMNVPNLTGFSGFLLLTGLFFVVIIGRYLLIAGIFYGVFYKWFPAKWDARKINKRPYKQDQLRKEVTWSTITALIFSVAGSLTVLMWQLGWTKVY